MYRRWVPSRLRYGLHFLLAPLRLDEICPICGRNRTKAVAYGRAEHLTGSSADLAEAKGHNKYRCMHCGHFFTNWLDDSIGSVARKYSGRYGQPPDSIKGNVREEDEKALFRMLCGLLGPPRETSVLDFGCGPNVAPTLELRAQGYDAHCCDILEEYDYDGEVFFKHENDATRRRGAYDGIISLDVVEHLGNTIESWTYFNRILKPQGKMVHSFPSQFHYRFDIPYFAAPFHTCLFSPKSLGLLMEKTGFRLDDIVPFQGDIPWAFVFTKTRDV